MDSMSKQQTESTTPGPKTEREANDEGDSRFKRAAMAVGGLVGLGIVNIVMVSFATGFAGGSGSDSLIGVFAVMGAFIYVAPFNYVLFDRFVDWIL